MFEDVSTIIASASAVVASAIAVYGINVWRREHLGRRRIDLAEEVLALFYEAADVISAARSPLGFEGEGTTRRSSEEETPQQKAVRDAAFVLIERLQSRNDLFARIRSLRYRFKAQNGRESAQPFEDLLAIRRKLIASSR